LNVRVGLSWLGFSEANLGAHNALKLQRMTNAKYWIPTHDEAKVEQGFTSLILTQNRITIEEALERERNEAGNVAVGKVPKLSVVGNGGSMVLA
jgi:hypothetical protein